MLHRFLLKSVQVYTSVMVASLALFGTAWAQNSVPHLETQGDHHALIVDGAPFLILGAQINNSSSWPSALPQAWPSLADIHANTVEAPVYWERLEPTEGKFDFSDVDLLVTGARSHGLHLILLWFGTWKNGQNHYVPAWVKSNRERFPRELSSSGKVLDVMLPSSSENLAADKRAFTALMHHLRETDNEQATHSDHDSGGERIRRDWHRARSQPNRRQGIYCTCSGDIG